MPRVAKDFDIPEKFLKLPKRAIPDVPKKIATILDEIRPNTKLIPTEIEFSDKTFISIFSLKNFKL